MKKILILAIASLGLLAASYNTMAQVIHSSNVIIQGGLCTGIDCTISESFGFDTIRLKENNLRIHFDDTSTGTFPSNDWRITVNDSTNGGANYFSVDDATAMRQLFKIEAGAPNNSLYIKSSGDIGLGTSIPLADVHAVDGNTPTLRLEQDGSVGWTPQIWDVAGNEVNFFIRDTTNNTLPFRIKPGAFTDSLVIDSDNDVGMGILLPTAPLHVYRNNATASVRVEEASATTAERNMLALVNNGSPQMSFQNSNSAINWNVGPTTVNTKTDAFAFDLNDGDSPEIVFYKGGRVDMGTGTAINFVLTPEGNLAIRGTLTEVSDVHAKMDFSEINDEAVLAKLVALPISSWRYKADESGARHVGPMAQDFYTAFGLGEDDRHIAPRDMASIALVGVKEVNKILQEKEARIRKLEGKLAAMEKLLENLQQALLDQNRVALVTSGKK